MICTAIAMEVGKHFANQKKTAKGLKHTRVIVASWDAKECGLREARVYTFFLNPVHYSFRHLFLTNIQHHIMRNIIKDF